MPMTLDEVLLQYMQMMYSEMTNKKSYFLQYQRGQIYSVAETARRETGGGDGCEVVKNDSFHELRLPDGRNLEDGQYTLKKYYVNR